MKRRKVVIGIHGMGNKPPRDVLTQWWLDSLFEGQSYSGLPGHAFRFELVYWAHHLHPVPYDITTEDEKDPAYLKEPYVPSTGKPEPKQSKLRRKALGYLEKLLDKLLLKDDLTVNYKSITDSIIRNYFKDLETYYSSDCVGEEVENCPARTVIRADLQKVLHRFRRFDILLLAHSMGTIISYDVLCDESCAADVHTFVTMGSPLGLPVIISRYVQERRLTDSDYLDVTTPPGVLRHWYNLSDLEDRVAFNYDLSDDYAANLRGVAAEDKIVNNDYEVDGDSNHHKVYGYLRTTELAAILNDFLTEGRSPRWLWLNDHLQRFWRTVKSRVGMLLPAFLTRREMPLAKGNHDES
jgi:hypothetical protein